MADNLEKYKKMPKWMECSWRRVACGKQSCPICGRIQQDRLRHIMAGENPDDMKSCLEDVGNNFKEILARIKEDCDKHGIDLTNVDNINEPPEPEEFSFYLKIEKWRKSVLDITRQPTFEFCAHTEAGQDLLWYVNTLVAKVYRQLCNKWHIKNGDEYGDFDYQYTARVLKECLEILKKSLQELIQGNTAQKIELNGILTEFLKLEQKIIKI